MPVAEPCVLTHRQLEVVTLLAYGHTPAHIANELGLSPFTVRNHVRSGCERNECDTSAQLVHLAIASGIVQVAHAT